MERRKFFKLFENKELEVAGKREGRSVYPTIVTPLGVVMTESGTLASTFPPLAAARSTMTLTKPR